MDTENLFLTPLTAKLMRIEYGLALIVSVVAMIEHVGEVRWSVAIALFAWIDVVGYLPGALAYRRSGGDPIHRAYHVAYNFAHSLTTNGLLALAWVWAFGFEWALLALPIHLFGDRALFGNYMKSFHLAFEPEPHPEWQRFTERLRMRQAPAATPPVTTRDPEPERAHA